MNTHTQFLNSSENREIVELVMRIYAVRNGLSRQCWQHVRGDYISLWNTLHMFSDKRNLQNGLSKLPHCHTFS